MHLYFLLTTHTHTLLLPITWHSCEVDVFLLVRNLSAFLLIWGRKDRERLTCCVWQKVPHQACGCLCHVIFCDKVIYLLWTVGKVFTVKRLWWIMDWTEYAIQTVIRVPFKLSICFSMKKCVLMAPWQILESQIQTKCSLPSHLFFRL